MTPLGLGLKIPARGPDPAARALNDSWTIGGTLGRGAVATVYRAKDADGRLAALKIPNTQSGVQNVQKEEAFIREHRLDELGVAPRFMRASGAPPTHGPLKSTYMAIELLDQDVFGAMERVDAGSEWLTHVLREKYMAQYAAETIRILRRAHSAGVVHRDIKAENVCIRRGTSSAEVYIVDWGCARRIGDSACMARGYDCSTERMLAPELEEGGTGCHPMDDMRAVAYMTALMVNRALPWDGMTDQDARVESKRRASADPFRITRLFLLAPLRHAIELLLREPREGGGGSNFYDNVLAHLRVAAEHPASVAQRIAAVKTADADAEDAGASISPAGGARRRRVAAGRPRRAETKEGAKKASGRKVKPTRRTETRGV